VDARHPFHERLLSAGVERRRIDALAASPCPPDIIGIDHYLTSDRLLDDDLSAHPHVLAGSNGRDRYVDVAAAHEERLMDRTGILPRLREVWSRYRLPLAITENHNGCTREEQLRWLMEAWDAARTARAEGADVVAVTSWALFGAIDWNSLLCDRTGFYESGAFDLRHQPPALTAVGRAVAALARTGRFEHPVLDAPGWWRPDAGDPRETLLGVEVSGNLGEAVAAACALRRIEMRQGPREGRLGLIRATGGAGGTPLRLEWLRQGEVRLTVEAAPEDAAACDTAVHAALDLVLDEQSGRLVLSRLGPAGQYRISRLSPAAPRRTVPPVTGGGGERRSAPSDRDRQDAWPQA
jgi:dTDP-4-dehydrorhamnose reductase